MQFDILNELLTSTVYDLFNNSETVLYQSKIKVKELEVLLRQENTRRNSSNDSRISSLSQQSDRQSSSNRNNSSSSLPQCKTIEQWIKIQAPKRLKQSLNKLGVEEPMLRTRKNQIDAHIDAMSVDTLTNQKKKVKNQLRNYDNDFATLFATLPNHDQKQPFRPLYVYYKKLKEHLSRRGVQELSTQAIQNMIRNIKTQRRQLRQKIEAYQKQFQQTNNRKIRYVKDINPIDYQYKRYKELKVQLQKYEEMLKNAQDGQ